MAERRPDSSLLRSLAAGLIGLAGAVAVWVATPYNNYILGNSNICDSYLPAAVLFMTLVLVMGVNPLLRRLRPNLALTTRQLAVAVGIMLIACVLPGQGLLRSLPNTLAKSTAEVSKDKFLAEQYSKMELPGSLFPDKIGFGQETPAARSYNEQLLPGQSIPWGAWVRPLLSWGTFLLFCWLMMIGLGMIVLPQWRHRERLAFPLLRVQQALMEAPQKGRLFSPLFGHRSFWVAVAGVFVVHLLAGAKLYYPESVPALPLKWDLSGLFTEDPWRYLHVDMKKNQVFFLFVGVAFFMPTRISFSIWFFLIVYGLYRGLAPAYGVGQYCEKMDDQRYGAVIMLTLCVLWVGRAHWARVFRSLFRRPTSEPDRRNRNAGYMFLLGIAGMFAWLLWAGAQPAWALMLVAFAFMVALLMSRIVAETGMPFVRLYESPLGLMMMAPSSWITSASLYMSVVVQMVFSMGGRVSAAVMSTHIVGLDPDATPKQQSRTGFSLVGVLVVGLVIAGAAHLTARYHHSITLDGRLVDRSLMNPLDTANKSVQDLGRGQLSKAPYNRYGHFAFGAGLAAGLYYLCLTVPQWPLHPFGMMLIDSYFGHTAWPSIFFGWLLQIVIVRFGGARLYRAARPFFIGLIIGEVVAAIFWALVPVVLVATNNLYKPVPVMPG